MRILKEDAKAISELFAGRGRRKGFQEPFKMVILALNSVLKEMQKDMDEKMDVLINIHKNGKL